MRNIHIFDIETGPRSRGEVLEFFNPENVKTGNLKDPQKIADKVAEAEASFIDNAALAAMTGEVVCIGIMDPDGKRSYLDSTVYRESDCLGEFWEMVRFFGSDGPFEWAGWFIHGFDLPFLIQRSFYYNVSLPSGLMQGRYFDKRFIDLMQVFTCGVYGATASLDNVGKFFRTGGKDQTNPCTGKTAHEFFRSSDPAKRRQGYQYLHTDLIATRRAAERMLGLPRLSSEVIGENPDFDPMANSPVPRTIGDYPIEGRK